MKAFIKKFIILLIVTIISFAIFYKTWFSTPTILMSPDLIKILELKLGFIQTLEYINNIPLPVPKGDYKTQLTWVQDQFKIRRGKVDITFLWQVHNWAETISNTHFNVNIRADARKMVILTEETIQKIFSALGEK